ncbi:MULTISPECIES: uridine kinase [Exiguobacterium]|jgi:uridine kinase|uniref:Uridine kinase n=1 Tax=Exiguobacterium chiriqhucha RW-2 TaxID=1345023 RepID=U1LG59_9BACL|nr:MULTISPECIES: uridine kinase [Exiguobacterium]ERG66308.1 uridine/cytidine kinase [Exiguobacterium chiriqhucha RW-2]KAB2863288.1 MAG: uridine kinase [Exiguobacterium chiriqhucha]TCI74120.1 uridine kinase [Exiguobacterium sp. IPCI3]TCI83276.1 uridine kinase [Exiguobacterium sp. IPCH1]TCI84329.1 uridine kinase [Exiguobacterium sp. IPBC4]
MQHKPVIIGVAGGTGSGKTTVARALVDAFEGQSVVMIEQDAYYKDQSEMTMEERYKTNYDHPFAFDNDLLIEQIKQLQEHKAIEKPVYDYAAHTRSDQTILIEPVDVVIVEGILALEDDRLRDLMDIKVFVDTDADVRILRRMQRDLNERGRSIDSVVAQYTNVVRPMHLQFCEPTKRYADIIVPEGGENFVAIDLLVTKIRWVLTERNRA